MQTNQNHRRDEQWMQSAQGLWLPPSDKNQQLPSPVSPPRHKRPWTARMIAGKSLWEWISLLLVPLLVGVGTIWVTNQQTTLQNALAEKLHANDQAIAQQARWDELLKAYHDSINTLILSNGLKQSRLGDDVEQIARSSTLDVLRQVDAGRRGKVLAYLVDLGLVQGRSNRNHPFSMYPPLVPLDEANLSGADLRGIHLFGAILDGANLSDANLSGTDLRETSLVSANLSGADLRGAELNGANLSVAILQGTIMPDGSIHP